MEYEIADKPQGVRDIPEGDRRGGLEEDPAKLRKSARREAANRGVDAPVAA